MPTISSISARQILDSRGNPTVEVDVLLSDGSLGRASVPSGASTGKHESVELRDENKHKYLGKSVEKAVSHVNTTLAKALANNNPFDQLALDQEMVILDSTPNLGRLGANAILAVSLAVSKAAALSVKKPYFLYINQLYNHLVEQYQHRNGGLHQPPFIKQLYVPRPLFNVMNGGAHTNWETTDFQEFMFVPLTARTFAEALEQGDEIYQHLKILLNKRDYSTLVGDEGGFAPAIKNNEEAIELILEAIELAGLKAGKDIGLALDPATSELYSNGEYTLKREGRKLSSAQMIDLWESWIKKYPIISIEDGLAEDDWQGWQRLYQRLHSNIMLVGDDFLVTNPERIHQAIAKKACNALLMKVNQIGTLSESLQAIYTARTAGWKVIVSHRSGETEDTSIADIAVGVGCEFVKMGALARSERTAKYNQLLRIEEMLHLKK